MEHTIDYEVIFQQEKAKMKIADGLEIRIDSDLGKRIVVNMVKEAVSQSIEIERQSKSDVIEGKLSAADLEEIGFKPIAHFTINNAYVYELGRGRQLSISCYGTPNEMLFICELEEDNPKEIAEVITLYNYDYDGYLTKSKLIQIVESIGKSSPLKTN